MKKILSVFLVLSLLASFVVVAFAASSSDVTISHVLTCDGKNVYTAEPGEEITVILTLKSSDGKPFDIKNIQSEVAYDTDFFELADDVDVKISSESAKNEWQTQESKHYQHRVFAVFAMFPNTAEGLLHCESSQVIAEYTLKVKDSAKVGDSGYVKSLTGDDVHVFGPDFEQYGETAEDLTVVIGTPAKTYTLAYMNGSEQFSTSEVTGKATIINGPTPAQGLIFLGWEDNNGKLWQPGEEYTPSADMTFTAKWSAPIKNYTVTFDTNGGSYFAPIIESEGTVVNLLQYVPTRSGYTFGGWYSDVALTTPISSITVGENTTIYAKWTKNSSTAVGVAKFILSFDTNGGNVIADVVKVRNTTVDLSKYITRKDGYTFDGWYTDVALTNKVTEIKMTSDIIVYAKWAEGEEKEDEKPNYKPDIMTDKHYAYVMGRDGGMIYPQANLTRAEAATIFFRLLDENIRAESLTKQNAFNDVRAGDWYNTAVSTLTNLGILNGRGADTFAPNATITRAELTTIVARLSEASYQGKALFGDIGGHWAEDYINIAASIGWVNGDNGRFRPNDNITRAEVMTLVNRALNRQPETKEDLLPGMKTWPDNSNESVWYYLAVQEATNSHDYEMKDDGVHEKWTALTESPDWSKLEE